MQLSSVTLIVAIALAAISGSATAAHRPLGQNSFEHEINIYSRGLPVRTYRNNHQDDHSQMVELYQLAAQDHRNAAAHASLMGWTDRAEAHKTEARYLQFWHQQHTRAEQHGQVIPLHGSIAEDRAYVERKRGEALATINEARRGEAMRQEALRYREVLRQDALRRQVLHRHR